MNEAVQSLQALLGRISGFFDIFDLSFIVSGASSLAALLLVYKLHGPGAFPDWMQGVYGGLLLVLGCYVLGMLSFILGRMLRRLAMRAGTWKPLRARLARQVRDAIRQHDLRAKDSDHSTLANYLRLLAPSPDPKQASTPEAESAALRLYTLMWTQVRQQSELAPSHVLLNRYWVMAALCDGMIVSATLWLVVLATSLHRLSSMQLGFLGWIGLALAILAMGLFLKEAERYSAVQIDDIVSTLAWAESRPPTAQVGSCPSASATASPSPAPSSVSTSLVASSTASAQPGHPTQ